MSSPVCLTQRYHQVYTSSGKSHKPSDYKYTFLFPQYLPKFYLSNITFIFYLVSCSSTMRANTNIAFTFYLCVALQQWQQTPTLHLPFTLCLALLQWQQTPTLHLPLPCVLLSNNDSKHQHCIYLYHLQAFVPKWTFCPQSGRRHHLAFITLHSQHHIHISIFITLHS